MTSHRCHPWLGLSNFSQNISHYFYLSYILEYPFEIMNKKNQKNDIVIKPG